MLDIAFIRENSDLVREAARKKRVAVDIDRLLAVDEKRRTLIQAVDGLRAQQNIASDRVAAITDSAERERVIAALREAKGALGAQEEMLKRVEEEYLALMVQVPNVPDLSVPEG